MDGCKQFSIVIAREPLQLKIEQNKGRANQKNKKNPIFYARYAGFKKRCYQASEIEQMFDPYSVCI